MGPHCSFCGIPSGPFLEIEGGLRLLLCDRCQAARDPTAGPEPPLAARYDPGEPELQWTCALCDYRCFIPTWLEGHTALEHPGWVARFENLRPYPRQVLRMVYHRSDDAAPGP